MEIRISKLQVAVIAINTIVPTSILFVPVSVVGYARQDAWLSMIVATLVGLLIAMLVGSITRQNPGQPFLLWIESRFGRAAGLLLGIVLSLYYLTHASTMVREFAMFVSDQLLLATPLYILAGIIVLVAVYMTSQGLEVIARINVVVLIVAIPFVLLSIALLLPQVHWSNFTPLLDTPPSRIAAASLLPAGWLSEITIFLLIAPYMRNPSESGKAAFWGTVCAGLMFTGSVIQIIAVFSSSIVPSMAYPLLESVSIIEVGRFLERVDVFIVSFWIAGMFAKSAIFIFGFMHCVTSTFRVRDGRPLVYAAAALIICNAVFAWRRESDVLSYISKVMTPYFFIHNVLLLALIWIGLRFTRHKVYGREEGS